MRRDRPAAVSAKASSLRRQPPLDSLRAFEAAARRLSFTEAAEELHVTQGAVSQRIKSLEHDLHVPLFRRLTRSLELTPWGERLFRGIRPGLDRIANALAEFDVQSETGALTVSVLPSFARLWLMPRLPRFRALHPEIDVQVLADGQAVDLNLSGPDVAIRFGHGKYPGLAATYLMPDSVQPVASPNLLARHPVIETVEDLIALPLIYDTPTESDHSKSDWRSWLTHLGAGAIALPPGLGFNQADLAIDAALLGLGVALARTSLIAEELASGRLLPAYPYAAPTAYAYYLLCRPWSAGRPRIARFRDWLLGETNRLWAPIAAAD
ncbi:MAG TPA: transcriptional regulator GcvA [Stellaceae bacterium]|nr:transcriptional regulator GcvA [Stellaceae bacterium]